MSLMLIISTERRKREQHMAPKSRARPRATDAHDAHRAQKIKLGAGMSRSPPLNAIGMIARRNKRGLEHARSGFPLEFFPHRGSYLLGRGGEGSGDPCWNGRWFGPLSPRWNTTVAGFRVKSLRHPKPPNLHECRRPCIPLKPTVNPT